MICNERKDYRKDTKIMKRRLFGLLGIVGSAALAYLIWMWLSGGEGLMRNVWRNTALAAILPLPLYSLGLLLGDAPNQEESDQQQEKAEIPDER
jgi:hypothetical protein